MFLYGGSLGLCRSVSMCMFDCICVYVYMSMWGGVSVCLSMDEFVCGMVWCSGPACMHVLWTTCGGQQTTLRDQFSPSTLGCGDHSQLLGLRGKCFSP